MKVECIKNECIGTSPHMFAHYKELCQGTGCCRGHSPFLNPGLCLQGILQLLPCIFSGPEKILRDGTPLRLKSISGTKQASRSDLQCRCCLSNSATGATATCCCRDHFETEQIGRLRAEKSCHLVKELVNCNSNVFVQPEEVESKLSRFRLLCVHCQCRQVCLNAVLYPTE